MKVWEIEVQCGIQPNRTLRTKLYTNDSWSKLDSAIRALNGNWPLFDTQIGTVYYPLAKARFIAITATDAVTPRAHPTERHTVFSAMMEQLEAHWLQASGAIDSFISVALRQTVGFNTFSLLMQDRDWRAAVQFRESTTGTIVTSTTTVPTHSHAHTELTGVSAAQHHAVVLGVPAPLMSDKGRVLTAGETGTYDWADSTGGQHQHALDEHRHDATLDRLADNRIQLEIGAIAATDADAEDIAEAGTYSTSGDPHTHAHADLTEVGSSDHHVQTPAHDHDHSHAHSELTGVGSSDHHVKTPEAAADPNSHSHSGGTHGQVWTRGTHDTGGAWRDVTSHDHEDIETGVTKHAHPLNLDLDFNSNTNDLSLTVEMQTNIRSADQDDSDDARIPIRSEDAEHDHAHSHAHSELTGVTRDDHHTDQHSHLLRGRLGLTASGELTDWISILKNTRRSDQRLDRSIQLPTPEGDTIVKPVQNVSHTHDHDDLTGIRDSQHHAPEPEDAGHTHHHADLTGITSDDHHTPEDTTHSHTHSELTGVGADDHHAETHSHAHSDITGVGANDHHPRRDQNITLTQSQLTQLLEAGNPQVNQPEIIFNTRRRAFGKEIEHLFDSTLDAARYDGSQPSENPFRLITIGLRPPFRDLQYNVTAYEIGWTGSPGGWKILGKSPTRLGNGIPAPWALDGYGWSNFSTDSPNLQRRMLVTYIPVQDTKQDGIVFPAFAFLYYEEAHDWQPPATDITEVIG